MKPGPKQAAEVLAEEEGAVSVVVAAEAVVEIVVADAEAVAEASADINFLAANSCWFAADLCLYELHARLVRNNAGAISHIQQACHGLLAVFAIVERALIYVHADEPVRHLRIQVAGKL